VRVYAAVAEPERLSNVRLASPRRHQLRQGTGRLGVYACSVLGTPAIHSSIVHGADDVVDGGRTAGPSSISPLGRRR
jgi:hypothetical protein